MTITLRDYQIALKNGVYQAWNDGAKNVCAVSPTGSGKAMTLCSLAHELVSQYGMPTTIMVHRKELVAQLCMTLAELDIPHNIIAQRSNVLAIIEDVFKVTGKRHYNYNAQITVVSVDTLNSRIERYKDWAARQKVWIMDETAHLLKENKWGKAIAELPNALGVGFTATPQRLDKKGLGRHAFGVFDTMIEGPTVKYLIEQGYLSKYKIVVPQSDYRKYLKDNGSSSSDYSSEARKFASMHSHVVGDVVENYKKFIPGKQAIVFADCIEAGEKMEREFLTQGIQAKLLTGLTPDGERRKGVFDYREGKIKVLINVDLFDEGFDVPGTDAVIMARPTKSLGKFLQCCGRGLRPVFAKGYDLKTKEGRLAAQAAGPKPHAVLIDHVGNVQYHGLPDKNRIWTLDNIVKRRDSVNLYRTCESPTCAVPYDRYLEACPHCGTEPQRYSRKSGESIREALAVVDGDLALLDPETIRELEAELNLEAPGDMEARVGAAAGALAGKGAAKKQKERIEMQKQLAEVIARWAGTLKYRGYSDRQINKKFYMKYDMSITMALSMGRAEMDAFKNNLEDDLRDGQAYYA